MGLYKRNYFETECDHEDCGFIEVVYTSEHKEAVEELKESGWIFSKDRPRTYCSNTCRKEATS